MPRFLSKQQVEQYHEQGFLAPVDVMPEDEAGSVAAQCETQSVEYLGPAGSLCLMHTRALHASAENRTQRPRSLYIATLTAVDAMPLVPCAVPSVYAGRIVHGRDPGRIRSIAFTMENPEIPSGASFFDQQAGN